MLREMIAKIFFKNGEYELFKLSPFLSEQCSEKEATDRRKQDSKNLILSVTPKSTKVTKSCCDIQGSRTWL